ncbi:hypothetical protein, partial [Shigella sonnei]
DESLIKQVLRAYIFCGACGNNRTNRGGFQFAAVRLPWFNMLCKQTVTITQMIKGHSLEPRMLQGRELHSSFIMRSRSAKMVVSMIWITSAW